MEKLRDFKKSINDDSIILISVMKNEYIMLEYFIKYYSSIGVSHFIFIDNDSSDDSINYILGLEYNIMLFRTKESYKESIFGTLWITNMMNMYCKDKWCVIVDMDEIVYKNNLIELRNKIKEQNATACKFYLLDMYPINYDKPYIRGEPFLSHSNYYDKESDINKTMHAGLRKRTMNVGACLSKYSFFKYNFNCCGQLACGYHDIEIKKSDHNCIRYYDKTQILLHFKFIKPNLKQVFNERVLNNQDWNDSVEYKQYAMKQSYIFYNPLYSLCIDSNEPTFSFIS